MSSRLRKLPLLGLILLAAVALGACGDSHTKVSTGTYAGESGQNAPYLDVGPLVYEVQLSRELNPYDEEDAQYLQGLSPEQRKLAPGQEWFGVFVQVYNNGSESQTAATNLSITDTQGNRYIPILPVSSNPYTYRAGTVAAKERLPIADSIASEGPIQGALLLFKIQTVSLDNRPLKLTIVDPDDSAETASAELDV
ncbi:MAG TPA: hypothetical protein VHW67_08390 [Solirubrobacteraceae bacterium]|jgi:hypothetical protein|nr:hypothetical protein [Solirubrobacteraceae bacterium]